LREESKRVVKTVGNKGTSRYLERVAKVEGKGRTQLLGIQYTGFGVPREKARGLKWGEKPGREVKDSFRKKEGNQSNNTTRATAIVVKIISKIYRVKNGKRMCANRCQKKAKKKGRKLTTKAGQIKRPWGFRPAREISYIPVASVRKGKRIRNAARNSTQQMISKKEKKKMSTMRCHEGKFHGGKRKKLIDEERRAKKKEKPNESQEGEISDPSAEREQGKTSAKSRETSA